MQYLCFLAKKKKQNIQRRISTGGKAEGKLESSFTHFWICALPKLPEFKTET